LDRFVNIQGAPNTPNNIEMPCVAVSAIKQQALPVPNYNGPNGWVYVPGAGQGLNGFQYYNEVYYAFQRLGDFQRQRNPSGGYISYGQSIDITISGAPNSVNNGTRTPNTFFAYSFKVYNPSGVAAANQTTAIASCTFAIISFSAPIGGIQTITCTVAGSV
jgi:hypothetical protein